MRFRPENAIDRILHIGIGMHRINDLCVAAARERSKSLADAFESDAKALPAMRGHYDELAAGIDPGPLAGRQTSGLQTVAHVQHRVDSRVARDVDRFGRDAFVAEIVSGDSVEAKWRGCEPPGDHAVHLFGKAAGSGSMRAESSLDVRHRDALVKSRESSAHCSRRVALYDHEIGPLGFEHRFETGKNARSRLEQRLPG